MYALKGLDCVSLSICEIIIRFDLGTTPLRVRQVAVSDKVASATAGRTYLSLYIVVKSNSKDSGWCFFLTIKSLQDL